MKKGVGEKIKLAAQTAGLIGVITVGSLVAYDKLSPDNSEPEASRPPRAEATAAAATPEPSGEAWKNPKYDALLGIGSNIVKRWYEAPKADRAFTTQQPYNAYVVVKAANNCSVRLAISSNSGNTDPNKIVLTDMVGGSVSASVECPGQRPIGIGARVRQDGVLETHWSQGNTQVTTEGNTVRTSAPVQPSFPPGAADKVQVFTLAQLDALANIPVAPAGKQLPKLPQLPPPPIA